MPHRPVPAPRRIRLSRAKGWRKPANTAVVARPSKWGNPFRADAKRTPAECAAAFACWVVESPGGRALAQAAKQELRGKNLACWCEVGRPCHADVLLRIANAVELAGMPAVFPAGIAPQLGCFALKN
jgi:hypothetical protein